MVRSKQGASYPETSIMLKYLWTSIQCTEIKIYDDGAPPHFILTSEPDY